MRRMPTARWISLGALLVGILAATPWPGLAQKPGPALQKEAAGPEVLSPKDGARVPRKDQDPPCPEQGPCTKVYVEGRLTAGSWPFLAVAPLNAAPRIWIQPPITAVKRDGTFRGMIYLGTDRVGAGEKYSLSIFACQNKQRFRQGEVLMGVPDDCVASDPVTVLRTK